VLYEMLTGEAPYRLTSARQMPMKIIAEPGKPVTELRKSTPSHMATALSRALETLPADRFATALEFAHALRPVGQSLS